MAFISREVIYGVVAILAAGGLWYAFGDSPTTTATTKKKTLKSASKSVIWKFPEAELALHFAKPAGNTRDIFRPLVEVEKSVPVKDKQEIMRVPANFAAGEANWIYTGMVEVNDVKMALVENPSTKQGGYLAPGDAWKTCQVVSVQSSCVLLRGPDGSEETVFRFDPSKPQKGKSGGSNQDSGSGGLRGPIGIVPAPTASPSVPFSPREGIIRRLQSIGDSPIATPMPSETIARPAERSSSPPKLSG